MAFGGAGPLNACGVAEVAGIHHVAIPHMAAVFSAYGIGTCDISQRYAVSLDAHSQQGLDDMLEVLRLRASRDMFAEGVGAGEYEVTARLVGVDGRGGERYFPLGEVPTFPAELAGAVSVELELAAVKHLREARSSAAAVIQRGVAQSTGTRNVLFRGRGRLDVPVYRLGELKAGDHAAGPAILEEDYFTCRVLEGWSFVISDAGDIMLNRKA